jgi:rare lipoprotein A
MLQPRLNARTAGPRTWRGRLAALLLIVLAGCAGMPPSPAPGSFDAQRDGPPADPPPGLIDLPDPEPRVEPIRSGGPNKPYEVLGQRYTPLTADEPVGETGLASWYGRKFHGRPTASGETYDMYAMSAAHRTMPLPSYARVRNPANGHEVVVRVNDRGPFHSTRIIDLSYAAALKLGVLRGVTPVEVQRLTHDDIRSGRWRGETALVLAAGAGQAPAMPERAPPAVEDAVAVTAPAPSTPASTPTPAAAPPALPEGPTRTTASAAPGFWVQLGAFRQRQGALDLRQQVMRELVWLEPWLAIFDDSSVFRIQAGPFGSRAEAQSALERIRAAANALQPLIVQRR